MGEFAGEGRGGRDWGVLGGARLGLLHAISLFVMLVVHEGRKQEGERRREEKREKKRRREGKKEKKKRGKNQT
jgi:hypothetical protein